MAPPAMDFSKRPRAKVGKRALARMNATDTSFKIASMAVRSQERSLDKNQTINQSHGKDRAASPSSAATRVELTSSRGNNLPTLQASLRHHAPAVRASGLKGIRDAVQSTSFLEASLGISIVEANLPSLLPDMCRCWLDEDGDVRALAISLFGDVLRNLSSSSKRADLKCLALFVPFLCTFASSALDSLDPSVRNDGASIVGMLASSEPSPSLSLLSSLWANEGGIVSAITMETGKHVDLFLPSLERLLSSTSLSRHGRDLDSKEGAMRKRKRDGNNSTQPKGVVSAPSHSILLSLAFLLHASLAAKGAADESNIYHMVGRRLGPSLYLSGEYSFMRGGVAQSNALLLMRGGRRNGSNGRIPVRGIFDLPSMFADDMDDCIENTYEDKRAGLWKSSSLKNDASTLEEDVKRMIPLLGTLYMKFMELKHSCCKYANNTPGLIMSTADLETMDVLVQIVRFVYHSCQSYQTIDDQNQPGKQPKINPASRKRHLQRSRKTAAAEIQDLGESLVLYQKNSSKMSCLLLEMFPIYPNNSASASHYELTNARICSALAELGGGSIFEDNRGLLPQWISSVFSYTVPRLNSISEMDVENSKDKCSGTEGNATNMLLKVVSKLLLPCGFRCDPHSGCLTQTYLLNNPMKRHELLVAFAGAFFPRMAFPPAFEREDQGGCLIYSSSSSTQVEQKLKRLASTATGKAAAKLLTTLIMLLVDTLFDPPSDDKSQLYEENSIVLLQMSSVLPVYLVSWEDRLPIETGSVLASLLSIIRQWSEFTNENSIPGFPIERAVNDLCLGLQCSLEALFLNNNRKPSIFESLPEQVQKLCLGLMGLLKPTDALAKELSSNCSRSFALYRKSCEPLVVSNNLANYILEVMSFLRKSMSLPTYLTFLIDSCGRATNSSVLQQTLMHQDEDAAMDALFESLSFYDRSIGQLTYFFTSSCDHASTKVLPMIQPVLQKWLSSSLASNTLDVIKQLVQARAAISIVAAFTWDELLSQNSIQQSSAFVTPEFLNLDEELDKILIECIINQFESSARLCLMEGEDYNMDDKSSQQQCLARLLGPTTLLLRFRRGMLGQFVDGVSCKVVQHSQNAQQQEVVHTAPVQDDTSSKKKNAVEVHMKALLIVLKSTGPVSVVDLVRSSDEFQNGLVSAMVRIEKAASGSHLANLGSKLLHQAKLLKQRADNSHLQIN